MPESVQKLVSAQVTDKRLPTAGRLSEALVPRYARPCTEMAMETSRRAGLRTADRAGFCSAIAAVRNPRWPTAGTCEAHRG